MIIETKRLLLREYTMDDFDALYEILSDPETMQHYPKPYDEEGTRRWLTWSLDNYEKYGFGLWAMVLKKTGELIGDCGVTMQNIDGEMLPEIGYHVHKKYWRQGFAKEAARAVRDWVFRNTSFDAVYSYMKYTNVGSYSTAIATGMKKVKEYPDPRNTISYAYRITRDEWEEIKKNEEDSLKPGKHFPASMTPPGREDVLLELSKYGFEGQGDIRLIDTSHEADDIRLNYIIDRKWVLRFCNAPDMTENRLREMNRLIERYLSFGLRCPRFLTDPQDIFFHRWNELVCYLAEYIDLPTAYELKLDPETEDKVWLEVLDSVAGFAEMYRDVDLSETFGMYSLFDLSPFDIPLGIDEKQQNFNSLCEELRKIGEAALVEKLEAKHTEVREKIRSVYRDLPHCVFQADENLSNVLVDENNHMAGLIDFNLAGTDVIVNQFANLGSGFKEEVKEPIGAKTRMDFAKEGYQRYQGRMLRIYHANPLERQAIEWYSWIALVAGWPQVCFFLDGLKNESLRGEILELLAMLAEQE